MTGPHPRSKSPCGSGSPGPGPRAWVPGSRSPRVWVPGPGSPGPRVRVPGSGSPPGPGHRVRVPSGSSSPGPRVPGPGSQVPSPGSRVQGFVLQRILSCFSSNMHTNKFHGSFPTILPYNHKKCVVAGFWWFGIFPIYSYRLSISPLRSPTRKPCPCVYQGTHLAQACVALGSRVPGPGPRVQVPS